MLYAGIDLGSTTGKVAAISVAGDKASLVAHHVIPSGTAPDELANHLLQFAADKVVELGLAESSKAAFAGVCATGYGREHAAHVGYNVSEISCHARGASWVLPKVRTIVDIGGQDLKIISLDDRGGMRDFVMNDKCAAGTGRFIEAMTRILHRDFEELSNLALSSRDPVRISSTCSVFAESEVVALVNQRVPIEDIACGIYDSIAERVFSLSQRVGILEAVTFTGGCAKSEGLKASLERRLNVRMSPVPCDPQIIGAVGAALFAAKRNGEDVR